MLTSCECFAQAVLAVLSFEVQKVLLVKAEASMGPKIRAIFLMISETDTQFHRQIEGSGESRTFQACALARLALFGSGCLA